MSNDRESSGVVATVLVVIFLSLVVFIIPVGFGYFIYVRQNAEFARLTAIKERLRAEVQVKVAEERAVRDAAQAVAAARQANTIVVHVDPQGNLLKDGQPMSIEQVGALATETSNLSRITLMVDPACTAEMIGEIVQKCLAETKSELIIRGAETSTE